MAGIFVKHWGFLSLVRASSRGTTFLEAKKTPDQPEAHRGFQVSALERLPAQLIGKLRNPARRWRKPSALELDRLGLPGPSRHRGCRRWKQRSAYRC